MKMVTRIILLFFLQLFFQPGSNAQNVGINTNDPNPSAVLEINSDNKGLLIPRIGLLSLSDNITIASPAISLLIYNTNDALPGGKGFYFNNGTTINPSWKKMISSIETAVAFASHGGATVVQPNTSYVLPQQDEDFDISNNFIPSGALLFANSFIAPFDGIYHFEGTITWTVSVSPFYAYTEIRVNAVNNISVYDYVSVDFTSHLSNNIQLNAGDKVTFGCKQTSAGPRSIFGSYFSGNLITRL